MIHGTKALLSSHQGFADDESLLSVHSVEHQGGRVLLTVSVPEAIFPMVKNLLDNGLSLVRWVETQNRVKKAIIKAQDPVEQQKRQDEYLKYSQAVLSKLDAFITAGLPTRAAIRKTKDFFNGNLTCHMIELMLSERRRIQKGRKK